MSGDDDERRIVVDCPVCKRTIWGGTTCYHGLVPLPGQGTKNTDDDEPKVLGEYKTKTRDRKRHGF
jgi:hypothetical protein